MAEGEGVARQKRHARTRQAILYAAQQIIVEHGTDRLSIREIANRIEYSPSGLYEYFRGKEEILQELCNEGFVRLSTTLRARTTSKSPIQRLIECGIAYLEFALQHPEQYLLMFSRVPAIYLSLEEIKQDSAYGFLRQVIQECIDAAEIQVREHYGLDEISYQSWALLHGIAMLRLTLFSKESNDFDAFNRRAVETAVESLKTR